MKLTKRFWIGICGAALVVAALLLGSLNKTLETAATALPGATSKPVVIIDAGHGGMDGGAAAGGIIEKEINLEIALKTRDLCQLFGFTVIMTRDTDISIHDPEESGVRSQKTSDLYNRLDIMTETPGAVVVSIHLNKFPQSYVHGPQVFYSPCTEASKDLAQLAQDNLELHLAVDKEREIKKADSSLFLLYNNDVNPAILVECGFISNPAEAEKLKDEEYQNKIAMSICYTLMKYNSGGDEENSGSQGE